MNGFRVFFLTGLVAASPLKADDQALTQALQSRYDVMKAAIANHDGNAVAAVLAPNFVSIDVFGATENAEKVIKTVSALPSDPAKESNTTLLSVKEDAGKAVVEQQYDMKTTKTAKDGAKHNIELVTVSTDTWVNSNGNWVCEQTVTNRLNYTVDGRSIIHKVRTNAR